MKILILCTGNSCRSQMARGFLQSFDDRLIVCSAGTEPAKQVNQKAVQVMKEVGIDISRHNPKMSISTCRMNGITSLRYVIMLMRHARF
jgi:arsenate reductase